MSDTGVVERVEALLGNPPVRRRAPEVFAALTLLASVAVVAGSAIEAHHWLARILSLCLS